MARFLGNTAHVSDYQADNLSSVLKPFVTQFPWLQAIAPHSVTKVTFANDRVFTERTEKAVKWADPIRGFAFVGPPGIGKSTLTTFAPALYGKRSLDLEDFYVHNLDRDERLSFTLKALRPYVNSADAVIVGGADLRPDELIRFGFIPILLWAPQDVYIARRSERDSLNPFKKGQGVHWTDKWLQSWFESGVEHYAVDVSDMREGAKEICRILSVSPSSVDPVFDILDKRGEERGQL